MIRYRIEWFVPARKAIKKEGYWSSVTTLDDDKQFALDMLEKWQKREPEEKFRLVKITEIVIG